MFDEEAAEHRRIQRQALLLQLQLAFNVAGRVYRLRLQQSGGGCLTCRVNQAPKDVWMRWRLATFILRSTDYLLLSNSCSIHSQHGIFKNRS